MRKLTVKELADVSGGLVFGPANPANAHRELSKLNKFLANNDRSRN